MSNTLISYEGYTIGVDCGADYNPLHYMQRSNPKTAIFPKGFKKMLVENYPLACFEMKQGGKVFGFRTQDIIEENFEHRGKK